MSEMSLDGTRASASEAVDTAAEVGLARYITSRYSQRELVARFSLPSHPG